MRTVPHWIGGKPAEGRQTGPIFDPSTGSQIATVAFAAQSDVDEVVAAARAAFQSWKRSSLAQRTRILFAFRELLDRNTDELARIISREHGKTIPDAKGEVARGLEIVEFACGIGEHIKGDNSPNVSTGVDSFSVRQPLGVVAGITPFNFPVMVPLWMSPIAIACGNTFVLKPSEKDPSAGVRLAELWAEAGLPDGVFNVLHGDKVAVDGLLTHPDVAAVSFVGSTPIAKYIHETATAHGKRVQALGGAKNHMVVLPDADLDLAADAAVSAGYGAAGERCMAISVVVAVGAIGDQLVAKIADRIPAVKVGPGDASGSEMGPLVTAAHRDKVRGYIDAGAEAGATLVADGRDIDIEGDGYWVGPTLFDNVQKDQTIYTDEIFGPVLSVVRASSYDEALDLVNSNPYANGVALFTCDGGVARQFGLDVEVGMVGINVPIPVPVATYSFGGWRNSLFGDVHMYGAEGVRFWTRGKVVTTRWPDPSHRGVDLGFPQNK
ncbi:CoA-acylating methylmalonate-semialdehyde dehydrogenase [Cryptosporangium phraense]|uniref:methylmalonate-semialdehyde dehydrogenase (CoA acylating) n=1 Tax=Cryptosporangium phraense TaxID=2593070 RepID=A0A545AJW6_9ACTN|nr:CoA-acylating methylmalonate-semialdehyde dehydrogenase [Cryptosporangium phraense]TQS41025.1 CoA-acylating methylmalonate-semialdehyde dehydrogenase [Cryptosporangium phraense]